MEIVIKLNNKNYTKKKKPIEILRMKVVFYVEMEPPIRDFDLIWLERIIEYLNHLNTSNGLKNVN